MRLGSQGLGQDSFSGRGTLPAPPLWNCSVAGRHSNLSCLEPDQKSQAGHRFFWRAVEPRYTAAAVNLQAQRASLTPSRGWQCSFPCRVHPTSRKWWLLGLCPGPLCRKTEVERNPQQCQDPNLPRIQGSKSLNQQDLVETT